jgi:DNA-binding NarL/FixJ family response regulator
VTEPLHLPFRDVTQVPRLLLLGQATSDDLVATLAESEQIELVGRASTADEALRLLADLEPDLILVDIDEESLRDGQAIGRILAARPEAAAVGFTRDADAPWIGDAVRSGLTAVVTLTDGSGEQLVADVCVLAANLGSRPGTTPPAGSR